MLGESRAAQKARVEEAAKGANDLTGLVRRRKGETVPTGAVNENSAGSNGKRKADSMEKEVEDSAEKKARVEDVLDGDGP
jgi:HAT1-interacting factor 1